MTRENKMKEGPRGGRRWLVVESKSFELLSDDVGGKSTGAFGRDAED